MTDHTNLKPKTKTITIRRFTGNKKVKCVFATEYKVIMRDKWSDDFEGISMHDTLQEAMEEFSRLKPRVDDPSDEAFSVEILKIEGWWDTNMDISSGAEGLVDDEETEVAFYGSREYEEV